MQVNAIGADANLITQFLIGDTTRGEICGSCPTRGLHFRSLQPLTDGGISSPTLDLCYGARSDELDGKVLKALSGHSLPSKFKYCPLAPNLFLEVHSNARSTAEVSRQACYVGAICARGIRSLQWYGKPDFVFDGNAFTLSATFHDGTLKIYAIWPTKSFPSRGDSYETRVEFRTVLAVAWIMKTSLQGYQDGLIAFRNVMRFD